MLIQGLENLNRAVHQDVVALQLFPQSRWVAPSSVLLQDEGEAKEDDADEEQRKAVNPPTERWLWGGCCPLLVSCCFILGAVVS